MEPYKLQYYMNYEAILGFLRRENWLIIGDMNYTSKEKEQQTSISDCVHWNEMEENEIKFVLSFEKDKKD